MLSTADMWDPNTWVDEPHEFRIYGDNNLRTFAVVDEIDYHWAIRWLWNPVRTHRNTRPKEKIYLRRASSERQQGVRLRVTTYLLHVEIMKRVRVPPSDRHTIVDHADGDTMNCRRYNLDWVTPGGNIVNRRDRP